MKSYALVATGEKVTIGGTLVASTNEGNIMFPVENETIPYLLREGIIREVEEKEAKKSQVKEEGTHLDIYYYVEHLAKRIHWNPENLVKYLNNLTEVNEAAVFSILLKEIAIVFDEKYKNHIENSREIWAISTINGRIIKVNKDKVANYRNFAAFRSLDEAIGARRILKEYMKPLFEKGGRK